MFKHTESFPYKGFIVLICKNIVLIKKEDEAIEYLHNMNGQQVRNYIDLIYG